MKETVETMIIKEICNKLSVGKHTQTCTVNSSYNAKYIIGERKHTQCGSCTQCTRNDCTECQNCLDMVKLGVSHRKKQASVLQESSELSKLQQQPQVNRNKISKEFLNKPLSYSYVNLQCTLTWSVLCSM